jgi:hypothetical protein
MGRLCLVYRPVLVGGLNFHSSGTQIGTTVATDRVHWLVELLQSSQMQIDAPPRLVCAIVRIAVKAAYPLHCGEKLSPNAFPAVTFGSAASTMRPIGIAFTSGRATICVSVF